MSLDRNIKRSDVILSIGATVHRIITTQDVAWAAALDSVRPLEGPHPLLFAGSGTSLYLSMVAAEIAQRNGIASRACPAADIWLEPESTLSDAATVVVITRSGTTSEALRAAETAKARGRTVVLVTCNSESPAAAIASQVLLSPKGDDGTIVMVRSFSSMLLLLQAAVAMRQGLDITACLNPQWVASVLSQADVVLQQIMVPLPTRAIFLGSGPRYGIAQEGGLKALEMGERPVLTYHPLEFRHGPWGSVGKGDVAFMLGREATASAERTLALELEMRGARVLPIVPATWIRKEVEHLPTVILPAQTPDLWSGPFAVLPLQLFAWRWSIGQGHDPDHPKNLTKVVELDG